MQVISYALPTIGLAQPQLTTGNSEKQTVCPIAAASRKAAALIASSRSPGWDEDHIGQSPETHGGRETCLDPLQTGQVYGCFAGAASRGAAGEPKLLILAYPKNGPVGSSTTNLLPGIGQMT